MNDKTGPEDVTATLTGVSFRDETLLFQLGSRSHRELLAIFFLGTHLGGEAVVSDNTGAASPRSRFIKVGRQPGSTKEKICLGETPPLANAKVTPGSRPWSHHLGDGHKHVGNVCQLGL